MLGQQSFRSVIEIADRQGRQLSFINLVEAFVLSAIRREHSIPLPKVRKAVDYLRRSFKTHRPLADEQFAVVFDAIKRLIVEDDARKSRPKRRIGFIS